MSNRTLTTDSLKAGARTRARRAQAKLQEAQVDLAVANESASEAAELVDPDALEVAHRQSEAAEQRVHEATEELDVARELLASSAAPPSQADEPAPVKHSGQGVKSLMPHIRQRK